AELLSTLRNLGIRLAMVTGKRLESAEISLQFFHLSEFFPILETGSPEGGVKPDRIKRALSRLNAVASEAIYIGDAPTDVDACRSVPIRILSAGWAAEADINGLREKKPDFLLTRFEDLERFFREHHENEGL
ncbi:MAG: HAD family hydrolase, partial [Akkermansia muciniphila]